MLLQSQSLIIRYGSVHGKSAKRGAYRAAMARLNSETLQLFEAMSRKVFTFSEGKDRVPLNSHNGLIIYFQFRATTAVKAVG
jgi:hypothetical protein